MHNLGSWLEMLAHLRVFFHDSYKKVPDLGKIDALDLQLLRHALKLLQVLEQLLKCLVVVANRHQLFNRFDFIASERIRK